MPIFGICARTRLSLQVFALSAWQSKLVSVNQGDEHPTNAYEDHDTLHQHTVIGKPEFLPRTDSQDAWIFRSPLSSAVEDATDFEMGRPR